MVYSRVFLCAACFMLWASTHADAPAQASLLGTVQLSYVEPTEVTVELSGPTDFSQEVQVTGGQVFTGLQPGTYDLTVSKEGYRNFSETLEVIAGQTTSTTVTLEQQKSTQALDNPGTLQLTWVDPGGVNVNVKGPDGYTLVTTVTGGQVLTGLTAGIYTLLVSKVGFQSTTHEVEVIADQTSSLSVVLERQAAGAQTEPEDPVTASEDAGDSDKVAELSLDELLEQGGALYIQSGCSGCHGGDGGGNQGPGFVGNDALADSAYVADILVGGNGGMPSFGARLSDEEIASVATYIRNSWGNDFGTVNPTDVAAQR